MSWSNACKKATIVFTALAVVVITIFLITSNRERLCEKGELFYEDTGSCIRRGTQGPCNDTMVIEETSPKSWYGGCACAYVTNQRPVLYHKESNKCYFIFSQGFCPDGFWINMTEDSKPLCEKNICLDKITHGKDEEVVPLKGGSCAILNKKPEGCTEVVQFVRPRIYPFCPTLADKDKKFSFSGIAVPNFPCPVGSYRNIMGECVPIPQTDIVFS